MTTYGEWWTANETEMGYYYIEVYQNTVPGSYSITLDIERQNDANTGEDAKADHQYSGYVNDGDIYGHLEDEDSADTYRIRAGNGDVIDVSFRSYSVGDFIYIDLLRNDGSVLVSNKSSSTDSGQMFQYYTANETEVNDFFLKVWMDTAPGDYVVTLQVQKQNDAGSWTDAPGTSATIIMLGSGSFEGWIFDLDTADMYKVPLVSGDVLDITLGVSYGSYVSMVLMNRTMYTLAARSILFGSYVSIRYCVDAIVDNTTTYLKIFGGSARYSLGITIGGQDDAGKGGDAGGVIEMGMPSLSPFLVRPGTFSGYMHTGDTGDSYSIDLPDNRTLNVTVDPEESLMVGIVLFNTTGSVMASEIGVAGQNVTLVHEVLEGGMMQFVLGSYGFFGNYTVTVTITDIDPGDSTPSAPVLTSSSGPGKVTLTWTAPADDGGSPITGYKIYKKESGSLEQAALLKTVGPGVLTYEDSYVLLGKTYQYYVTAVNAIGEGASSNMVLGSPTQSSTDSDDDGMPDDWEVLYDLNRFDPTDGTKDKDNDGFTNLQEFLAGTDPTDKDSKPSSLDTDNDGIPDWWELMNELSPEDSADALLDPDSDGRTNLKEYQDGTDPRVKDTPLADDDDDDDGDDDDDDDDDEVISWMPLGWVGCCIGFIILGVILLIIVLIVVLIIAKGRKKKDEKEEDDVPIAAGEDGEASEE
jgi:hypothetical protein